MKVYHPNARSVQTYLLIFIKSIGYRMPRTFKKGGFSMESNQASVSARISTFVRAYHSTHADPKIVGFRLRENLSPADIPARFFANRADGHTAFEHAHLARAVVA
jgi:hypothetical protein